MNVADILTFGEAIVGGGGGATVFSYHIERDGAATLLKVSDRVLTVDELEGAWAAVLKTDGSALMLKLSVEDDTIMDIDGDGSCVAFAVGMSVTDEIAAAEGLDGCGTYLMTGDEYGQNITDSMLVIE